MRNSLFATVLVALLRVTLVAAQDTADGPVETGVTSDGFLLESSTESTPAATAQPSSGGDEEEATPSSSSGSGSGSSSTRTSTGRTPGATRDWGELGPPDVYLNVPELSVGRIELDVDNLRAEINLAAKVANLVEINAGVSIGVEKVNITIADVGAELELVIRLGQLASIVNRTLQSLDLNPLLINLLDEVGDIAEGVIGAVDGLLGSVLSGDSKLNYIIDNLGNIIQEVVGTAGDVVHTIVGNYEQNMTFTGQQKLLDNGLIQKTYEYSTLGSLVNIIFNSVGQIVQATVLKGGNSSGGGGGSSSSTSQTAGATRTASETARPTETGATEEE
ncbi:unnamed protein product [Parascedosporium putredinis]|uniref:Uncharacterized protein n=1 Tax=Parascedosporium putredinis TaxID=1442378 RepID=A0A9P1HDF0_9PEZI|nr:unnamed protein product [Parascedosporium putredinis]CAI8004223.1 unnamed protein product [Parascedosporium putredinis]